MPLWPVVYGAWWALNEFALEERQRMQADDDGMAQPYIKLEGIKQPRSLSWAEERALRQDLVEGAHSVLNGEWHRSRAWRECLR